MRVMKMQIEMVVEGLLPIPEDEDDQFPLGPLAAEHIAKIESAILPEMRKHYAEQNQRFVSVKMTCNVVEI